MKRKIFSVSVTTLCCLSMSAGAVFANNFVVGQSSTGNVLLNDAANWRVVRRATVTIPASDGAAHGCVATASADMDFSGPQGVNQYLFVLSHNDFNPVTSSGSERTLVLIDNGNGIRDPGYKPVSTTLHFRGLTNYNGVNGTGTHTFYFLGRKRDAPDADSNVLDASLSVVCVDTP